MERKGAEQIEFKALVFRIKIVLCLIFLMFGLALGGFFSYLSDELLLCQAVD